MNQTIRLLAEQAGVLNTKHYDLGSVVVNSEEVQKFAEILVFECTKIAVFKGDTATAKAIKEHFAL